MPRLAPASDTVRDSEDAFIGPIRRVDIVKGFGFIAGPMDRDIFFHVSQLNVSKTQIVEGAIVSGTFRLTDRGFRLASIQTFSSPTRVEPDTTKSIKLKVCWYDSSRKFGFAALFDTPTRPNIMFHHTHLLPHGRESAFPNETFEATLTNYRGSGRYRVQEIIRFEPQHG